MNLNLSASLNVFRILAKPSICLPHATVSSFKDLPIPLDSAFGDSKPGQVIKAVVLDKDDCFAYPGDDNVYESYKTQFDALKAAYPGRCLLIVSNTAGSSFDRDLKRASAVESATGVAVLSHQTKKPGCGAQIMDYFRQHPETGVTAPSQIAIVGDRLTTDMMLANMMGSYGVWIKDGVVPLAEKSLVSTGFRRCYALRKIELMDALRIQFARLERKLGPFLMARGIRAADPTTPFD